MSWLGRLFGRGELPPIRVALPEDPQQRAAEFWQRWSAMLPEVSGALGDNEPQRFETALCDAVAALHPDLHFSVEAGQTALYALVVTGQEDPELRAYTDAWKATAPPDDHLWEYHDHVPPVPDPDGVTVNLGAARIALADVRLAAHVDEQEGVVDVAVHHPALADLSPASRDTMTFLPLDATLGERLAARRLRRVETALREPDNAITLRDLRDIVHRLENPGS